MESPKYATKKQNYIQNSSWKSKLKPFTSKLKKKLKTQEKNLKTQGKNSKLKKKLKTQRKNSKLKEKTQVFGIFICWWAMGKRGPNYKPGVSFILVGIVKHRVRIVVVAVVNAIIIQYALYYYFYYYLPYPALHNPNSNPQV